MFAKLRDYFSILKNSFKYYEMEKALCTKIANRKEVEKDTALINQTILYGRNGRWADLWEDLNGRKNT